ncbi:hypothetical protein FOZ62_027512, partial [Perkinsus olseni]
MEKYGCSWEMVFKLMKRAAAEATGDERGKGDQGGVICEEEFVVALASLLPDYLARQASLGGESSIEAARRVFQLIDDDGDGFIALSNLRCAGEQHAGDERAPVMVDYRLPLSSLSCISTDTGERTITLLCDDKFVASKEWKALKSALDPCWVPPEVNDHRYSLESYESSPQSPLGGDSMTFAVLEGYCSMWQRVVRKCSMDARRVVIEGYDGQVVDHPRISGSYMRDGWGVQEYPPESNDLGECLVYRGHWKNHVFDGEGVLARRRPSRGSGVLGRLREGWKDAGGGVRGDVIYRGQWRGGKKHGRGVYYFQLRGPEGVVYHCVYEGEFRDDAFCGQGVFRVRNVELVARSEEMYPGRIVSYYGAFAGEGTGRGREGGRLDEARVYDRGVTPGGSRKSLEFLEFFRQDDDGIQPCGRMPVDDTLAMYSTIGDVLAICLDGVVSVLPASRDGITLVGEAVDVSLLMKETETYCGELLNGRPHGRGVKRVPVATLVAPPPPAQSDAARDAFSRSLSSNVSGGTVFTAFTSTTTAAGRG